MMAIRASPPTPTHTPMIIFCSSDNSVIHVVSRMIFTTWQNYMRENIQLHYWCELLKWKSNLFSTRFLLYIHADCWTYPILYHSPEQLTILICCSDWFCLQCLQCFYCLFVLFHNVCKTAFCYIQSSNMEEIKIVYCIVL